MQHQRNGQSTANFRVALGAVKQGQHMTPATSTIDYGPSQAQKQSKDKAVKNLLINKFGRLDDLDNIKLKGPIDEYTPKKSFATPEQPNINITSSLKSNTYQTLPTQKVSPTPITNTYSSISLLYTNDQAMPVILNTPTQLHPKVHDEPNQPPHITYNQPLKDKSSSAHGLEDTARIMTIHVIPIRFPQYKQTRTLLI